MNASVTQLGILLLCASPSLAQCDAIRPLHLDDIHYIVDDASVTSKFLMQRLGAQEMAQPGTPIDFISFYSLRWMGPTITVTPKGPYKNAAPARNQRWLQNQVIPANSTQPVYGVYALCMNTASLSDARKALAGVQEDVVFQSPVQNGATNSRASFFMPDGCRLVMHESTTATNNKSPFAIESIWMLVKDKAKTARFFEDVFAATVTEKQMNYYSLQVADAKLILFEPAAFGLKPEAVAERNTKQKIWLGIDHLGFLYADVHKAYKAASDKGYRFNFAPLRYVYNGEPTVYQLTSIQTPDDFSIELVAADGRIGPQTIYLNPKRQ